MKPDILHVVFCRFAIGGHVGCFQVVMERIQKSGLDVLTRRPTGGLARFRGLDLVGVINRMRSLQVAQEDHGHF